MKQQSLFAILLLATMTSAYAAEESQPTLEQGGVTPVIADSAKQIAAKKKPLSIVLGVGVTFGGDTLGTAVYADGSTDSIKAGSGLLLHTGLDYRLNEAISLQGTLGYHFDTTMAASNGSATFSRIPLDLLAYYHVSDSFRVGGGPRTVFSPKIKTSGVASGNDVSFDNTIGLVIEGEYMPLRMLGVKLRYVSEKYKPSGSSYSFDGSHFGVLLNVYL